MDKIIESGYYFVETRCGVIEMAEFADGGWLLFGIDKMFLENECRIVSKRILY